MGGYFRWSGTLKGLAAWIKASFVFLGEYSRWSGTLKVLAVSVIAPFASLTSSGRLKSGDSPSVFLGIVFSSSRLHFRGKGCNAIASVWPRTSTEWVSLNRTGRIFDGPLDISFF